MLIKMDTYLCLEQDELISDWEIDIGGAEVDVATVVELWRQVSVRKLEVELRLPTWAPRGNDYATSMNPYPC